jgi:hypothetical protein
VFFPFHDGDVFHGVSSHLHLRSSTQLASCDAFVLLVVKVLVVFVECSLESGSSHWQVGTYGTYGLRVSYTASKRARRHSIRGEREVLPFWR